MNKRTLSVALAFALSGATLPANASIIERDLVHGSNDKLITYDSSSNLEWLDLTVTKGRSFSEVKNGWSELVSQGFRFASANDLAGLGGAFGLTLNQSYDTYASAGADVDSVEAVKTLANMIGITFVYEDEGSIYQRRSAMGYLGDKVRNSEYGSVAYASIEFYELGWTTLAAFHSQGETASGSTNSQYSNLGSFLVRTTAVTPLPEPETYSILLTGLGLMGLMMRRRKNLRHT